MESVTLGSNTYRLSITVARLEDIERQTGMSAFRVLERFVSVRDPDKAADLSVGFLTSFIAGALGIDRTMVVEHLPISQLMPTAIGIASPFGEAMRSLVPTDAAEGGPSADPSPSPA